MIDYKEKLAQRIHKEEISEILDLIENNEKERECLFSFLFSENESIGYQVAWIFTHCSAATNLWLYQKQDELINEVLICKHVGKRRVLLSLLYKQLFQNPPRVDFLNFCMDIIINNQEPTAIISTCMKIAYELCLPIPELMSEFTLLLETMQGKSTPAIESSYRNIQKAMKKKKSLRRLDSFN